jgi:hypothetical protein
MPSEIEEALAAWRAAERRQSEAVDGDGAHWAAEAERWRTEFHRLSAEHMIDRIDALHEAEGRRRASKPSTNAFHDAAKDEKAIAAEIWETARQSDEDTPQLSDSQAPPSGVDTPRSSRYWGDSASRSVRLTVAYG